MGSFYATPCKQIAYKFCINFAKTEFPYRTEYSASADTFVALSLRNDLYCVGWGVKLYSLTH